MKQAPSPFDANGQYIMPNQRSLPFIAGIDPDLDENGLIIYDRKEKAWLCKSLDFYDLTQLIRTDYTTAELEIVVESGWLNDTYFHRDTFPKEFDDYTIEGKIGYATKAAIPVGINHGVGKCLVSYFEKAGYKVHKYQPVSKKWDKALFKHATGLKSGYKETIRDAARAMWTYI